MLISSSTHTLLLYGSLAVAAACVGVIVLREDGSKGIVRQLPVGGILVGLAAALWVYLHHTEVVVVHDGSNGLEAERLVALTSPGYSQPPGKSELSALYDPSWVVNESSKPVRIVHVTYGRMYGVGDSEPDILAPGMVVQLGDVDHIGPDDVPPRSVEVDSRIPIAGRTWVTWDRGPSR